MFLMTSFVETALNFTDLPSFQSNGFPNYIDIHLVYGVAGAGLLGTLMPKSNLPTNR